MKKVLLIPPVLAFLFCAYSFGQKPVIELTFTADYNGQHVSLDSILIQNLTQGCDTTLYAPDTVLSISYQLGIEGNAFPDENAFYIMQNYPNPFKGQTTVQVYLPEKDKVKLSVSNLLGDRLAFFEQILGSGHHSFTFYAGMEGCYMLSVLCSYGIKTIRMIGLNSRQGSPCRIVYDGLDNAGISYKSQQGIGGFKFTLGDLLQYTGYTALSQVSITDSPTGNKTYDFQIPYIPLPCPGTPTVTYGGQVYNAILIGTQCWLKENLNIGIRIDGIEAQTANGQIEKYCLDDLEAYCDVYGGLYQWKEMMQYVTTPGAKGICPEGWHLPTDAEYCTLTQIIDPTVNCSSYGYSGTDVGIKLKSTTGWCAGCNGTNASGFTALPGGWRLPDGSFDNILDLVVFWSSSESGTDAWTRYLSMFLATIGRDDINKYFGFSVRCVKDTP